MTWCPLLCYPLSPSPVNIERFFKLGAKFCRKIYSSQALNCFLLLVHTASSFATGLRTAMGKFLGTYMQTCIIKILGNNFQQQLQHPITKKADAEPKKSRSNKKSRCRTSLLKNGPTKLPCLLIILASWVDFFDIGLLLYPVPHHTLQCYTRKSFWVTRTGESKLFCIGFSLFWGRCRTWCNCLFILKVVIYL